MATSDSDTERFSVNQRLKCAICIQFKERVDPVLLNDALSHKVRLTEKQEDEMRAKFTNSGRWTACDYLFNQLVKKTDWFKYLLKALAHPHVRLGDFAEICKQKEAEIKCHSGETTSDGEETGYLKLLDERDGIGESRMQHATVQCFSSNEEIYDDGCEYIDSDEVYDDAKSLPAPAISRGRPGRPSGNGHGSAQTRTIQHAKAAVSPLQNEYQYNTVYDHVIGSASPSALHQESPGSRRGKDPPPRAQPLPDDDGYTQIFSRGSPSLVRPENSSRETGPHRPPQYRRKTVAGTHPHVVRFQDVPEGQPLRKAATSQVRPASGTSRDKSDDDERTRLSKIYSSDTWEGSSRSGFRSSVVCVPQPSPDYYNTYVRKAEENAQTLVSRYAYARVTNRHSGNSENSLRPTSSSRKDVRRSMENSYRGDNRIHHGNVSSRSLSGEGRQPMSQYGAPSSQPKAYSDLNRGESFGTPSDSTQREGETEYQSKGEGHTILAEAGSNMPTTKGAKVMAAGGDFTRAEVDTELTSFPGYTPNIADDEVRKRMQRCKDNTYIVWYSEWEQRPTLGVMYNSTFMIFTIKKRSSYNGSKFFVDRDQKDGYSLTELLKYHLEAGIKDTRPSSYRQKIWLKYPFLE